MVRSRRTKIAAEDKARLVLAVLAGEMSVCEAARRLGVSPDHDARLETSVPRGWGRTASGGPQWPAGDKGTPEQRRMQLENEQLKLALAEATVQLRIWQRGAELADQVPSRTSKP